MAAEYIVKRPEDEVGKRLGRVRMLARVGRFTLGEKFARFRERDNAYGKWRPRDRFTKLWRHRSAVAETGERFFIQRSSDRKELLVHKVQKFAAVPDLMAHPDIEAIHWAVWKRFGDGVRSGGLFYCRFVAGTSIVSRHGYLGAKWKGAAEDIFGVGALNSIAGLRTISEFIVRQTKAGELNARTVIYADKRWTPSTGWVKYSGEFHTHVHVDVEGGHACTP